MQRVSVGWLGAVACVALGCSSSPGDVSGKPVSEGNSQTTGGSAGALGSGGSGQATGGSSGTAASGGTLGATGGSAGSAGKGATGGGAAKGGKGGGAGSGSGGGAGTSASAGTAGTGGGSAGTTSSGGSGDGPTVGGCAMFPPDDAWNTDVSGEAVDQDWTTKLENMVGNIKIHPDYGGDASELYGIPVGVVPATQPAVPVVFDWYPDESDPGPYPFPDPAVALIEGGDAMNCDGDCHLLVVQQGTCQLYEGYACHYDAGWHCGNGAHWDLTKNSYGQRPKGWTSADAAGLAIAPGILRYDEVRAGAVEHAIRFTTKCTRANYVAPATHDAVPSSCDPNDPNSPPMGLRVRLKADYDISSLSASAQVVLTAMKHYGMILADNGSNFYFQGEANLGWTDDDINPLKSVPASAFEVVTVPPLEN
ncbi:MAG TPA: hypothetical protein VMI54_15935 [Polyangiaceae bacterium]|nr:hypothetical protein [Polyangiaceae bacterium]